MNKRPRSVLPWIILLSLIIVGLTPLIPVTVSEPGQLQELCFGAPIPFIVQNSGLTPQAETLPDKVGLLNPREHLTQIIWGNYLVSTAIVGAILWGLAKVYATKRNRKHNHK